MKHVVTFTSLVNLSSHASLIRSAVAGAHRSKTGLYPLLTLALLIASFMAKKTDPAKNNGGSPTA